MNDDELREGLAAITAREQVRVAQEVVEERFLNGISQMLAPHDNWPMLDDAALHGLAGGIVHLLESHTEADHVALLASFLAELSTMLNRAPLLLLDGSYHPLLFWPVLVQFKVVGSSRAASSVQQLDCIKVPLAKTTLGASPMEVQSAGGSTGVHLFVFGS